MGKLIYIATTSVDSYVADERGNFEWTAPDEERHLFVNDLVRRAGTFLMGRRMYDTLVVWEDPAIATGASVVVPDFHRIWRAAEKVVFSRLLQSPRSEKTRIVREFNRGTIHEMKVAASSDLTIGGPELAMQAMRAGLVDEIHLFVVPILVGSGNRALKEGIKARLEVLTEHRFHDGTMYTAYSVGPETMTTTAPATRAAEF